MTLFHPDSDADLLFVPAIPVPHDDAGPTHISVITLEPYYRANEEYTVVYADADSTVYSDKSIGI